MHKVFVYGILKGMYPSTKAYLPNHKAFKRRFMTFKKSKGHEVFGEIVEVDDSVLEHFDFVEGNGEYYWRYRTKVVLENGQSEEVWVYQQIKDFLNDLPTKNLVDKRYK